MMHETVLMAEISWVEYERRLIVEDAIVLVPVGAVEQHGPHMPLGTDAILSGEMARRAAERVGGIVAPTLSYGYKSQPRTGGGDHFPGSTGLDGDNLSHLVTDVVAELGRTGAKKIALIDGHYENQFFLTEGCEQAIRRLEAKGIDDVKVLKMRYPETVKQETLDYLEQFYPDGYPGLDLEHGGILETSMMLYLFPHLVDMNKVPQDPPASFPPFDLYPHEGREWVPESGVLTPATNSSAEIGRMLVEEFVELVAGALRSAFRSTDSSMVERRVS
ncbi:MAG: creatininase [Alphaproteobacteria bacterium]|nr:creatininase [Alphaproteobacteria bacterium]